MTRCINPGSPDATQTIGMRMHDSAKVNNFDMLRLVAATSVIVAHAYLLDGRTDPYTWLTDMSLGLSAVVMFFAISGFLIAQSLERRTLLAFAAARALRIFPGLAVCVFVTAVALAPLSTFPVTQYLANHQTMKFVLGNATLLATEYRLPGVFSDHEVNGSLWTLRYEVACYALLALTYVATVSRPALRNVAVVLVVIAGCFVRFVPFLKDHIQIVNMADLFMPFLIGSWVFWSGRRITIVHVVVGIAGCAALSRTPFYGQAATLTVAMVTLWIALTPIPGLVFLKARPDYSYGIYIYAYPLQQVISEHCPSVHPIGKALIAFLAVLVPASLSWHFVEKPSLMLKRALGAGAATSMVMPAIQEQQPSKVRPVSSTRL
jgi:peptidoglycan/LPS O-acetylase OafA/YrhL